MSLIRLLPVSVAVLAASPAASAFAADACLDEIKALYDNELNGYNRKPYRSAKTVYDANGKETHVFDNIVENPLETISGVRGTDMTLTVGQQAWVGPSAEGPWSSAPANLPPDRKAGHDAFRQAEIDGMSDGECGGEVDLDGRPALKYAFHIKTAPVEEMGGMWLADRNTIWLDPETKDILRWDKTDFQSNWAPEVDKALHVEVYEYDKTIKVDPPQ